MTTSRAPVWVVAAALLVLGACGTRVGDQTGREDPGALGPPAPTADTGEPGVDAMFGTIPVPCSDGDTSGFPSDPDIGVTAETITIATISDPGGPRPGLNQGVFDAMEAFVGWCNELGGINGRELQLELLDARITEYRERVLTACDDALALVGGVGALDDTGVYDAIECGIPNVPAAAVSALVADAALTYQPLPNPPSRYAVGAARWVAGQWPEAVENAGIVRTRLPITEMQGDRLIDAYEQVGYEFVYDTSANINETNWAPVVLAMQRAGVEWFTLVSSFEELLPLLRAATEQGFSPEVIELESNFYDPRFPRQAAEAGLDVDGVLVRLSTWPFEEADERPATEAFLEILATYGPAETEPDLLGAQAFSAALMFATAAERAGPELTRGRLSAELGLIDSWDGGGLHGETDPAANQPTTCFVLLGVDGEGFERVYPLADRDSEVYESGGGMACPEDGMAELSDYEGLGAE